MGGGDRDCTSDRENKATRMVGDTYIEEVGLQQKPRKTVIYMYLILSSKRLNISV